MAEVDIEISSRMARAITDLAVRHYGDNSMVSQQRVVEAALKWSLKKRVFQKPQIIWHVEEGSDEVYNILMKEDEDAKS